VCKRDSAGTTAGSTSSEALFLGNFIGQLEEILSVWGSNELRAKFHLKGSWYHKFGILGQ